MKRLNVKTRLFTFAIVLFLALLMTAGMATAQTGNRDVTNTNGQTDAEDIIDRDIEPKPVINTEDFVTLSGVVRDSSGNPVHKAWVGAEFDYKDIIDSETEEILKPDILVNAGDLIGSNNETDENGAFSLSVVKGYRYDLFVNTKGLASTKVIGGYFLDSDGGSGSDAGTDGKWSGSTTNDWSERTLIEAGPDGIAGITINLKQGSVISGKALDSDGSPVSDLWVSANADIPGGWGGSSTNDQGEFSIIVYPGEGYRVSSWPWKGGFMGGYWKAGQDSTLTPSGQDGTLTTNWDEATLLDASGDVEINIIFEAAKTISGTVKDKSGDPVADVWVSASTTPPYWDCCTDGEKPDEDPGFIAPNQRWFGANTDKNGNYEIAVYPASDYRVSVDGNGVYKTVYYKDAKTWEDATPVDVSSNSVTGTDFVLDMGKSISGTVSGLGADDIAHIEIWSDSSKGWGNARVSGSDSGDASFKVRGLPDGSDYRINVWGKGFLKGYVQSDGSVGSWEKAALFSAGASDVKIIMNRGRKISGTISGLSAGDHVRIEAWTEYDYCEKFDENRDGTDTYCGNPDGEMIHSRGGVEVVAEGPTAEFTIDTLAKAPNFRVQVWAEGYISGYYGGTPGEPGAAPVKWDKAVLVSTADGDVAGVNIAMSTGNTISGVVTGLASGDHAWVSAVSDSSGSSGGISVEGTGSDVAYKITCLSPGSDFRVFIEAKGYIGGYYSADGLTDWKNADLLDSSANPENISLALSRGKTISGTVTGLAKGEVGWIEARRENSDGYTEPAFIEKCDMADGWCGNGRGGNYWGGASVEGTGSPVGYTISGLAPGDDYIVTFRAKGYATDVKTGVDSSTDPTDINFVVSEGKHISGTIKGAGPDEWVSVHAWSETMRDGGYAYVQADAEGNATYEIKGLGNASDYIVSTWAGRKNLFYNQQMSWDSADKVDLTNSSDDSVDFDFSAIKMYAVSGSVAGVTDEDTLVWVDAWSENTGAWGNAEVKGNGDFSIKLPAGNYKIGICADGYLKQYYDAESGKLTHDWEGAKALSVVADTGIGELLLSSGNSISGTVKDSEGNTVISAWVEAHDDSKGFNAGAMTSKKGTYHIGGLPDGTYTVSVWSPEGNYSGVVTIDGSDVTHDISLGDSDTGKISGNFTDNDHESVEENVVFLFDSNDKFVNAVETDASGEYSFGGLEPGDYTVKVRKDGADAYEILDTIEVNSDN